MLQAFGRRPLNAGRMLDAVARIGTAPLILHLGARWLSSRHGRFTPGKEPGTH